jgi:hypothetical protein
VCNVNMQCVSGGRAPPPPPPPAGWGHTASICNVKHEICVCACTSSSTLASRGCYWTMSQTVLACLASIRKSIINSELSYASLHAGVRLHVLCVHLCLTIAHSLISALARCSCTSTTDLVRGHTTHHGRSAEQRR